MVVGRKLKDLVRGSGFLYVGLEARSVSQAHLMMTFELQMISCIVIAMNYHLRLIGDLRIAVLEKQVSETA